MEKKTIEHPNGFKAVLYGKRSMSIYTPEGRECLHTGSRSPQTEEQVMECLEEMPELLETLGIIATDDDEESEEE